MSFIVRPRHQFVARVAGRFLDQTAIQSDSSSVMLAVDQLCCSKFDSCVQNACSTLTNSAANNHLCVRDCTQRCSFVFRICKLRSRRSQTASIVESTHAERFLCKQILANKYMDSNQIKWTIELQWKWNYIMWDFLILQIT